MFLFFIYLLYIIIIKYRSKALNRKALWQLVSSISIQKDCVFFFLHRWLIFQHNQFKIKFSPLLNVSYIYVIWCFTFHDAYTARYFIWLFSCDRMKLYHLRFLRNSRSPNSPRRVYSLYFLKAPANLVTFSNLIYSILFYSPRPNITQIILIFFVILIVQVPTHYFFKVFHLTFIHLFHSILFSSTKYTQMFNKHLNITRNISKYYLSCKIGFYELVLQPFFTLKPTCSITLYATRKDVAFLIRI